MRSMMRISITAAAIASLAILPGCEDSPISAGADYTMTLISQPSTVPYDEEGIATLSATVFDADGVPQPGITVFFSNSGGALVPASGGVETNAGGIATATLTLDINDAEDVDVTATSATLSETVTITRSGIPVNRPPTAVINPNPVTSQISGEAVVFDGSASFDADAADFGDYIKSYKWEIFSNHPDAANLTTTPPRVAKPNPIIILGTPVATIPNVTVQEPYWNVQHLTVTLTVTDSHDVVGTKTIPYDITAPPTQ